MPPTYRGRRRRPVSRLDHEFAQSGSTSGSIPNPVEDDPTSPLTYFWTLVESDSLEDVLSRWSEFTSRSAELRRLAKNENIDDALWHLGRGVDANPVFDQWAIADKREAILATIA